VPDLIADAIAAIRLEDPVIPEEPREGEPGGAPCSYCAATDAESVWANSHWRAMPRHWSSIPGGVVLLSKAHVDTLGAMPAQRQAEFGVIAGAVENAIMSLGAAARVHMYRWGDGRAHFHVHFIPRPLGRRQLSWRYLPFYETLLPRPATEEMARVSERLALAISKADLPS